jgi:hypothetical protein
MDTGLILFEGKYGNMLLALAGSSYHIIVSHRGESGMS